MFTKFYFNFFPDFFWNLSTVSVKFLSVFYRNPFKTLNKFPPELVIIVIGMIPMESHQKSDYNSSVILPEFLVFLNKLFSRKFLEK